MIVVGAKILTKYKSLKSWFKVIYLTFSHLCMFIWSAVEYQKAIRSQFISDLHHPNAIQESGFRAPGAPNIYEGWSEVA